METKAKPNPRVIGLDCHPDSFTAAILSGPTPAAALTEKVFNHLPLARLARWAQMHTTPEDLFVLEASGNSFHVVRVLQKFQRQAKVLESQHLGKLKEAHANNDRISAVRIAKAYLAGTAKEVWLPDPLTQERRDWFHAHRKAVKRATQMTNRIKSYLSDSGVRLDEKLDLSSPAAEAWLRAIPWTPRQWQVLYRYLLDLRHAQEQNAYWENLISQEVLTDAQLLNLVRLCGVRDIVAFGVGALIGDINRFENPKKLVSYFGLFPSFDDSGEGEWRGGIKGHGRRDVRSLLIQGAQAVMKTDHPLGKWGRKLASTKQWNVAVVAVARRIVVAIWYMLKGRWSTVKEIDQALRIKIGKILSHVGQEGYQALNKTRQQLRAETYERLKTAREYCLDLNKKFLPRTTPATGAPMAGSSPA